MASGQLILQLAAIFLAAVILSALFSALETAFISISRLRAKSLFMQGKPGATALVRLKEHPRRVLITLLFWNNAATVVASAVATVAATHIYGDSGVGIAVGGVTLFTLFFCEVVPKTYAAANAERIATRTGPLIEVAYALSTPVTYPLNWLAKATTTGFAKEAKKPLLTENDLDALVTIAVEEGTVGANEAKLVRDALDFNDHLVEHVMTPAADWEHFTDDLTIGSALDKAVASRYYRFPIIDKTGKVIGIVSEKMLLEAASRGKTADAVTAVMMTPLTVPLHTPISHVFELMQKKKRKLIVVADVNGGTLGLLSLEDILEELIDELNNF